MDVSKIEPHHLMANSNQATVEHMLDVVGASDVEELFEQIPAEHRLAGGLELPPALVSEADLSRHMDDLLSRDVKPKASFLGGGCWPHYVPAVVDEIVGRAEFLNNIWGTPSSDLGRTQSLFEFCSQLGELLELDFVGLPVYSWGCAAGHAMLMAQRINGRSEVLVAASLDPERRAVIETYAGLPELEHHIELVEVATDWETGCLDLEDFRSKLSDRTAAIYLENPSFLGTFEASGPEAARLAKEAGAEVIVGVDPIALGVTASPSAWGADIVVGTIQSLGVHMNCGGGASGFIASRDEERYARQYPTLCLSAAHTAEGDIGFSMTLFEQTSYGSRELGNDWTGNSTYLWAIAASVYMALLGPRGFEEIGRTILGRSHQAAETVARIPGVEVRFGDAFFKEFVADFNGTGKTVAEINASLREQGIFGGLDLSGRFPELGQSALICVTEVHQDEDIALLGEALTEAVR
ncbi:MAG: glycine dehydrogenase [Solirubrobacterales bacterium 67-14]|nr:MAG: glycine dehydrogenase [Solirubrobacterales bacterium 67-14]